MNIPIGQHLLDELAQRQADGQTIQGWADELKVNVKTLYTRIHRTRHNPNWIPMGEQQSEPITQVPEPEVEPGLKDEVDGNDRKVYYLGPDVRTLDELIEACQIDLDEWIITKTSFRKWSIGAKLEKKDLYWSGGKILDGYIESDGTLTVAPLFYVRADCVRKEPEAVTPVVQPVRFGVTILPVTQRSAGVVKRVPIIPDAQIGFRRDIHTAELDPFHDRQALDVVLQIVQDGYWDGLGFLGDWNDWTEWTDKFAREPEFYFTTQPAVKEAAWWLLQFRLATPGLPAWMVDSNHEGRLDSYLQSHLMAACKLKPGLGYHVRPVLSVPHLLGLDDLMIEWVDGYPDSEVWLNDELKFIHGSTTRGNPGATAAAVCNDSPVNVIFGHIHRIEQATRTEYRGGKKRTITAVSPGCLCRVDGAVPGHSKSQNWQQGMAIANYTDDGFVSIEVIEIHEGRAIYQGKMYEARDRTEEIDGILSHKDAG